MERDYRLGQIIEFILEDANNMLEEYTRDNNQVNVGSLITYASVLKTIQEQLAEEERKSFKLDFDIDKKYM